MFLHRLHVNLEHVKNVLENIYEHVNLELQLKDSTTKGFNYSF